MSISPRLCLIAMLGGSRHCISPHLICAISTRRHDERVAATPTMYDLPAGEKRGVDVVTGIGAFSRLNKINRTPNEHHGHGITQPEETCRASPLASHPSSHTTVSAWAWESSWATKTSQDQGSLVKLPHQQACEDGQEGGHGQIMLDNNDVNGAAPGACPHSGPPWRTNLQATVGIRPVSTARAR